MLIVPISAAATVAARSSCAHMLCSSCIIADLACPSHREPLATIGTCPVCRITPGWESILERALVSSPAGQRIRMMPGETLPYLRIHHLDDALLDAFEQLENVARQLPAIDDDSIEGTLHRVEKWTTGGPGKQAWVRRVQCVSLYFDIRLQGSHSRFQTLREVPLGFTERLG